MIIYHSLVLLATLGLSTTFAVSPSECQFLRATTITDSSATLEWEAPATGEPTTGFLIHCQELGDVGWTRLAGRGFFDHTIDYTGLSADVAFNCRCRAWSAGETKPKSSPVYESFRTALPDTQRSGIPGDPVGIVATWWSDTAVRFEWSAPVDGGVATGYQTEFRSGPAQGQWGPWTVVAPWTNPQTHMWFEATGVVPGFAVHARVKSVNAHGVQGSTFGAWKIQFTNLEAPTPGLTPVPTPVPTPPPYVLNCTRQLANYGCGSMAFLCFYSSQCCDESARCNTPAPTPAALPTPAPTPVDTCQDAYCCRPACTDPDTGAAVYGNFTAAQPVNTTHIGPYNFYAWRFTLPALTFTTMGLQVGDGFNFYNLRQFVWALNGTIDQPGELLYENERRASGSANRDNTLVTCAHDAPVSLAAGDYWLGFTIGNCAGQMSVASEPVISQSSGSRPALSSGENGVSWNEESSYQRPYTWLDTGIDWEPFFVFGN